MALSAQGPQGPAMVKAGLCSALTVPAGVYFPPSPAPSERWWRRALHEELPSCSAGENQAGGTSGENHPALCALEPGGGSFCSLGLPVFGEYLKPFSFFHSLDFLTLGPCLFWSQCLLNVGFVVWPTTTIRSLAVHCWPPASVCWGWLNRQWSEWVCVCVFVCVCVLEQRVHHSTDIYCKSASWWILSWPSVCTLGLIHAKVSQALHLPLPSESWGLRLQDNPATPSVGRHSSGFSLPLLTLLQIFQDLAGLPWSRSDLGFPRQTWFICWLLFFSLTWAAPSESLEARVQASVQPWRFVGGWGGAHNYLESSTSLRCWRQLFLGPGRQITTVMPPNAHTSHTCSFFHARADRPVYLPGQSFTRSVTACSEFSHQDLARGRTPASVPRFGFGVGVGVSNQWGEGGQGEAGVNDPSPLWETMASTFSEMGPWLKSRSPRRTKAWGQSQIILLLQPRNTWERQAFTVIMWLPPHVPGRPAPEMGFLSIFSLVGRGMPRPLSRACEHAAWQGIRDFAGMIKLRILR